MTAPSGAPSGPAGGLSGLVARLEELPDNHITYVDGATLHRRTYPELHDDIQRVIAKLRAGGVGEGSRVGLLGPNSYDWVAHELALLDLGCVTVTFPWEDFADHDPGKLRERYEVDLLLRHEPGEAAGPGTAPLSVADETPPTPVTPAHQRPLDPDVFTLVFSSGTTGALKCIQIGRAGSELILGDFSRHYTFQPDDAILVGLPLSTFQQRQMLHCAIWHGFDAIVAEPSPLLLVILAESHPTIMGGPPGFYEIFENRFRTQPARTQLLAKAMSRVIRTVLPGELRQRALRRAFRQAHGAYGGRIRLMLSGSAPLRRSTQEVFDLVGLPLFQLYGLTESGFIAWNRPDARRVDSVGRPVFDGSVRIADDGEVQVRWPVAQSPGYFDEPDDVQASTYLDDGYIATGDLGRLDEDGFLFLTGRKKDIIITRAGVKVQPSPIEQRVMTHPDVRHAVLLGGGSLTGVGAVIAVREGVEDVDGIRRHVQTVNGELSPSSRVVRTVFTRETFSRENGLMTRALKLDRAQVADRFRSALEAGEEWA